MELDLHEVYMQRLAQRIAIFVFVVLVSTPLISVPNSQAPRQALAADSGWKFLLGDPSGAEAPSFADASWRTVDLPHDWSIEGRPDKNNPTGRGGGYFPAGIGWYRKAFNTWEGGNRGHPDYRPHFIPKIVSTAR